jgi:hypothetical protein
MKTRELAGRFRMSQPAVSISVKRREKIVRERGLNQLLP